MQERAELTRAALTRAAAEQFAESGYERTRLNDVARAAHQSRGALSFHFPAKADLAAAVLREACDRTAEATRELRAQEQSALRTLLDLTRLLAGRLAHDPLEQAALRLAREVSAVEPGLVEPDPVAAWRRAFAEVAREAERDGSLAVEAATAAELALRLACGGYVMRNDGEAGLAGMLQALLPALGGQPSLPVQRTASDVDRGGRAPSAPELAAAG